MDREREGQKKPRHLPLSLKPKAIDFLRAMQRALHPQARQDAQAILDLNSLGNFHVQVLAVAFL